MSNATANQYAHGRKLIGACTKLLGTTVAEAARVGGPPSSRVLTDMALTAAHRAGLVRNLFTPAFVREAAILTRTIWDLDLSASFIYDARRGAQREHRAARFVAFERVQNELLVTPYLAAGETFSVGGDAAARVLKDLARKDHLGWTGLTSAQMVRQIENRAERARLDDLIRFRFISAFSAMIHPTPMGMRRHQRSGDFYGRALLIAVPFVTVECLQHVAVLAIRSLGLESEVETSNAVLEIRELISKFALERTSQQ